MYISESQKQTLFTWIFIIIYFLYIVTLLGLLSIKSEHILQLRTYVEAITCVLLIARFNPIVSHVMTPFDKTMIFSISMFLLSNIVISELFIRYSQNPIISELAKLNNSPQIFLK